MPRRLRAISIGFVTSVAFGERLPLPPRVDTILSMHSSLRSRPASGLGERGRPGPDERRREGSAGRIVYPVVSRRSGGLSLGVDLFPDAKSCNFDCPYCEVFPLEAFGDSPVSGPEGFSLASLEEELEEFLDEVYARDWAPDPIRDICLSGSGESTTSPFLGEALDICARARRDHPGLLGSSSLVLITNSTGFLESSTSDLLLRASREEGLVVWAKLDAGRRELFRLMSGTEGSLEAVAGGILSFSRRASVVIQTMLCDVDGHVPSDEDLGDYCRLLARLRDEGARVSEVHVYTFARPSPKVPCAPLSDERLRSCAELVRARTGLRVRAFGSSSELLLPSADASGLSVPVETKPTGLRRLNPEGIEP
jgi:wyosine [tRNA(Phe)-imidazoG37] synthetase (radical SAM superfamily)